MRTAIDVGGTFTDVVTWDGTRLVTGKVTTTRDQSEGVVAGLALHSGAGAGLVHGTTVATNAVLQRAGATTVLVTDAGFEDLIEIGIPGSRDASAAATSSSRPPCSNA